MNDVQLAREMSTAGPWGFFESRPGRPIRRRRQTDAEPAREARARRTRATPNSVPPVQLNSVPRFS